MTPLSIYQAHADCNENENCRGELDKEKRRPARAFCSLKTELGMYHDPSGSSFPPRFPVNPEFVKDVPHDCAMSCRFHLDLSKKPCISSMKPFPPSCKELHWSFHQAVVLYNHTEPWYRWELVVLRATGAELAGMWAPIEIIRRCGWEPITNLAMIKNVYFLLLGNTNDE